MLLTMLAYSFLFYFCGILKAIDKYCTQLINSTPAVTCDQPDEILVSSVWVATCDLRNFFDYKPLKTENTVPICKSFVYNFITLPCDLGQVWHFVKSGRPVTCDLSNWLAEYSTSYFNRITWNMMETRQIFHIVFPVNRACHFFTLIHRKKW
jgi:hypothetical protein